MLTVTRNNNGYLLSVDYNGHQLHFKEWDATDACIYYMPLSTLVDNGLATYDKEGCFVPFDSLQFLDEEDRCLLGLPMKYPYAIRLRSEGDFKSQNFKYCIDFLSYFPDGDFLPAVCYGTEINLADGRKFTMTNAEYRFKKLVDRYNVIDSEFKTFEYTLRKFAEIKDAAIEANVHLDSYLEGENVYIPKEIRLDISREGNSLTVLPSVDIKESEKFKRTFDRQRKVLDVYPVTDEDGNRTRVVLSDEQKESLVPIKRHGCRYSDRDEIVDIIEHPTEYFDPDQFDLSQFYSERVIDLGFYKPKFYPFVSPYKSVWIAGATIEHPVSGTASVTIQNEDELSTLETAIETACQSNLSTCNFNDVEIDVSDARFLLEMARKQLRILRILSKLRTMGMARKS